MLDSFMLDQIKTLPEAYQKYLTGDSVSLITNTFAESHNLESQQKNVLANGFNLYLILLFNKKDFINFLTSELNFTHKDSLLLHLAMSAALPKEVNDILDEFDKLTQNENTFKDLSEDIATAEKELQSLRSMQTMASDEKSTPTPARLSSNGELPAFPSMQADLLQKNNPVSQETPKWGSDN